MASAAAVCVTFGAGDCSVLAVGVVGADVSWLLSSRVGARMYLETVDLKVVLNLVVLMRVGVCGNLTASISGFR